MARKYTGDTDTSSDNALVVLIGIIGGNSAWKNKD